MAPQFPTGLRVTYFSLAGDEQAAEELVGRELSRVKGELERKSGSSGPEEAKVFTAWLMPKGSVGPRTQPHEFSPIHLPWANRNLAARVRAEIESLYARGGMGRVREFLRSVDDSAATYVQGRVSIKGMPSRGSRRNAVLFDDVDEASTAGTVVQLACRDAFDALKVRVKAVVERVGPVAATLAMGRLVEARREIESERPRYLTGERVAWAPGVEVERLEGPEVGVLLEHLRDLLRLRSILAEASSAYEARLAELMRSPEGAGMNLPPDLGPLMEARFPDAVWALQSVTDGLALALTVYGRRFPILFRIWNGPEIPQGVRADSRGRRLEPSTKEDAQAIERLLRLINGALNTAWALNSRMAEDIESNPSVAWRYPPVVSAALDRLGFKSPSVEEMAARERMAKELGVSTAATLAMIVGAVDVLAAVSGAAPPVGLTLACFSLILGSVDNVLEFQRLLQQEAAFNSVLDPGKALSVEPDYDGLLVGMVCSLLDLKGVRDALGAVKAAQRAELARAAVKTVTP